MATVAHRALANENKKAEQVPAKAGAMAAKGGKPGAAVPTATRRRALAEVGNLVDAASIAAAAGKTLPPTKTGVVTRMAARKAATQSKPGDAEAKPAVSKGSSASTVTAATQDLEVQEISSAAFHVATDNYAAPIAVDADVIEAPAPAAQLKGTAAAAAWDAGLECRTDKAISTSALLLAFSEEASATSVQKEAKHEEQSSLDIDWEDHDNPQAVTMYVEDIYSFYRKTERDGMVPADYMSRQSDINENMRAILLDWLIEVHLKFKLMPETMYLTTNLIDRYLAITPVTRRNLQLVGVTAMLVASKYEEIWAPEVKDFVYISDNAYNRDQILSTEKHMLNSLKFNLTVPTPYVFAARFIKAAAAGTGGSPAKQAEADKQTFTLVWYLLELCLPEYSMLQYPPSMLAAAAVYTALAMSVEVAKRASPSSAKDSFSPASLNSLTLYTPKANGTAAAAPMTPQTPSNAAEAWTPVLVRHTGYTAEDLRACASQIVSFHAKAGASNLKAVHKKYSHTRFGSVAKLVAGCPSPEVLFSPSPNSASYHTCISNLSNPTRS